MWSGDSHSVWRRGLRLAVLALLGLMLVACGGGSEPFGKDGAGTTPKGKTPPPVSIQSLTGLPPDMAHNFKTALAVSAGQHDIGIVEGDLQTGSYGLEGIFQVTPDAGGSRVGFQWILRDNNGVLVDQSSGEELAAATGGADPWSAVTPAVLQRIADKTAQNLALKFASLGFATRVSALVAPPAETFALAGPGAANDIDLETLNGPGYVDPATVEQAASLPESQPALADMAGKTVIKAVAVIPVRGSPGPGNEELAKAMRQTLAAAGWPVISGPRQDALTIAGIVDVAEAKGPTQTVRLRWEVSDPVGAKLGDVKQANDVPAGSLDQGWGANATAVAEAAATGIFDLIRKYR